MACNFSYFNLQKICDCLKLPELLQMCVFLQRRIYNMHPVYDNTIPDCVSSILISYHQVIINMTVMY